MALEELLATIPAPEHASEVEKIADWAAIEEEVGAKLPADYKDCVREYGSGVLADFIRIFNPFSASEYTNLVASVNRIGQICRQLKESEGSRFPFDIFPTSPGLLPWGTDDNGNWYFWLTEGAPNDWPVVVGAGRNPRWQRFDCSMTTFLTKALKREIVCKLWPSDFPDVNDPVTYRFVPRRQK
jgi:hypothetical protein